MLAPSKVATPKIKWSDGFSQPKKSKQNYGKKNLNTLIELKDIMQRSLRIVFTLEIKLLLNYSALMILEERKLVKRVNW